MSATLFDPLTFARGPAMPNRFMLAPLTNLQSHADGTLSDEEFHWLTLRSKGDFGFTMTCAAYVQPISKAFNGQIGLSSDIHIPGLARLADAIRAEGSVSAVQLQHAGMRADPALIDGPPVAPYADATTGARALSTGEVEQVIEDFILCAIRAEKAGFDGVALHGGHGYLITQFLTPKNERADRFGGSFENRCRFLFEMLEGLRARTGPDFQIGLRISPERFGIPTPEAMALAQRLLMSGLLDHLDISMWDAAKDPEDETLQGRTLLSCFTGLQRGNTRLGVAGKIFTGTKARMLVEQGADYVLIGRGAILHQDFPKQVARNPDFECVRRPVTREYLESQGLGPAFIDYMATSWGDFVVR